MEEHCSGGSATRKAHPTNGEAEHEQRTDQHSPSLGQISIWTQNQPEAVGTLEVGSIRVRSQGELNHGIHLQPMTGHMKKDLTMNKLSDEQNNKRERPILGGSWPGGVT